MLSETGSDLRIVSDLREGDPTAQVELLNRYGEPLVRFLVTICRADPVDAEDIAVETLYRAINRIDLFVDKPESNRNSFRNWLFTIARNLWRDRMRRELRMANVLIDSEEFVPVGLNNELKDTSPATRAVQEGLTALPESQRLTLVLHYSGLQLQEVAQILGVKPGKVRQWKRRGLITLANMLRQHPALVYLTKQESANSKERDE